MEVFSEFWRHNFCSIVFEAMTIFNIKNKTKGVVTITTPTFATASANDASFEPKPSK